MTKSSTMRIGFFLFKYQPQVAGGMDIAFVRSIRAIVKYQPQHEYIIIANENSLSDLKNSFVDIDEYLRYYVVPYIPNWLDRVRYGIKRYLSKPFKTYFIQRLEELDLDVLHFPRQEVFQKIQDVPVILTLYDIQHEYYPEFFNEQSFEDRHNTYKRSIELADAVAVATEHAKMTVVEKFPEQSHKCRVIYPGHDTHWKRLSSEDVNLQLAPFNLPDQFILFPANPWLHKNHAHMFAALRSLKDKGITIPVVCTGRLKEIPPATLQQLIIAAGIQEIVFDLGYVDGQTMQALYQKACFLVFPSLFEGFGYPILEAQANDCPVVCANHTTLPEVAGNGAHYFDPLNTEDIAQAIETVWTNLELQDNLRKEGRQNLDRFSWDSYAKDMLGLCRDILKS